MRASGVFLGPVGAPAAHQVQHLGVLGYELLKEPAHGQDSAVVDVHDEAGHGVELGVVGVVLPLEKLGREALGVHHQTQPPDERRLSGGGSEAHDVLLNVELEDQNVYRSGVVVQHWPAAKP